MAPGHFGMKKLKKDTLGTKPRRRVGTLRRQRANVPSMPNMTLPVARPIFLVLAILGGLMFSFFAHLMVAFCVEGLLLGKGRR